MKTFVWAAAALMSFGATNVQGGDLRLASASAEFPAETAAIVAATTAFFDQVEQAEAQPAPERPVIAMPEVVAPARADDAPTHPLAGQGPVSHLTAYEVSWYPMDRFMGSVDFMGTWNGNRNLVCGFLTWDLTNPDIPVLETVSATYLDVDELRAKSDQDVHVALLEANCAHGAIDANYTIFDTAS